VAPALTVLDAILTFEYECRWALNQGQTMQPRPPPALGGGAQQHPQQMHNLSDAAANAVIRTPTGLRLHLSDAVALVAAFERHTTSQPEARFMAAPLYDGGWGLSPSQGVFGVDFTTALLTLAVRDREINLWILSRVVFMNMVLRPKVFQEAAAGLSATAAEAHQSSVNEAMQELGSAAGGIAAPSTVRSKDLFARAFVKWVRAVTGKI
jgi:hypothetical protein